MQQRRVTSDELRGYLKERENTRLEFKLKYELTGQNNQKNRDEIAKDILALLNTAGRDPNDYSYLILGAGDELRSDGTRDYERVVPEQYSTRQFLDIVNERCRHPKICSLEYQEVELDNGRLYGVLVLPPSPYVHALNRSLKTSRGKYFGGDGVVLHRLGEGVAIASVEESWLMRQEKRGWALTAKRITDPKDIDLHGIWDLQRRQFGDNVDPFIEMQDWVSEMQSGTATSKFQLNEVLLALKHDARVVGYLFAQHYVPQQFIFMSYIGFDKSVNEARHYGIEVLLRKLREICDPVAPPWKCIVGEVDEAESTYLFDVFRGRVNQLGEPSNGLFVLEFDYIQPAIRPRLVGVDSASPKLKILFLARDKSSLVNDSGTYMISSGEAEHIFNVMFLHVYSDGYPDNIEYKEYLRKELAKILTRVGAGIRLLDIDALREPRHGIPQSVSAKRRLLRFLSAFNVGRLSPWVQNHSRNFRRNTT